jgi:hypothetical protein
MCFCQCGKLTRVDWIINQFGDHRPESGELRVSLQPDTVNESCRAFGGREFGFESSENLGLRVPLMGMLRSPVDQQGPAPSDREELLSAFFILEGSRYLNRPGPKAACAVATQLRDGNVITRTLEDRRPPP